MDWLQFGAAVISSLAWPIAVVAIVLFLRKQLAGIVPLIRTFKYGEFRIDLGEKLREVETDLAIESSPSEPPAPAPEMPPAQTKLAQDAPRGAIVSSWLSVEEAIDRLVSHKNMRFVPAFDNHRVKMRLLRDRGIIDDLTFTTYQKLSKVRDQAIHLSDLQLDYEEALSMTRSCGWLIARLEEAMREEPLNAEVPGRRQY
ncbi:hypothetical protein AAZU54_11710 [Pseudomonas sp. Je.1.5.c]|uniref:hypothetical protein n=1 Tax=Pseudomonas sp. Je.1.5.c TaxID=3142839 RepID=UPI003DA9D201